MKLDFQSTWWAEHTEAQLDKLKKEDLIKLYILVYRSALEEIESLQEDKNKIISLLEEKLKIKETTIEYYQRKIRLRERLEERAKKSTANKKLN